MESLWRWLISVLVWLSTDPAAITAESPRSAAAVAVAYAALAQEPEADPKPVRPVGPVNVPAVSGTICPTGNCPVRR